jgi:hypothetical protein
MTVKYKARSVFIRSGTGIVGSNPTRGMDICLLLSLCCLVWVTALRRADHPSKGSYRLSIRSVSSELILNGNRPESLIRQGRRRVNYTYLKSTEHCSSWDVDSSSPYRYTDIQPFMGLGGSFLLSQEPSTDPYPDSEESNRHLHAPFVSLLCLFWNKKLWEELIA